MKPKVNFEGLKWLVQTCRKLLAANKIHLTLFSCRVRAAQISEPRLMVSAIIGKPVNKLQVENENSKLDVA